MSSNGFSRRNKPCFIFLFSKDNPNNSIAALFCSTCEQHRREFSGTVIVGVNQDNYAIVKPCLTRGQFDGSFQFPSLKQFVLWNANGAFHLNAAAQIFIKYPSQQERDSFDFSFSLDNRDNTGQLCLQAKESELVRRDIRFSRIGTQLIHTKQLSCCIHVVS